MKDQPKKKTANRRKSQSQPQDLLLKPSAGSRRKSGSNQSALEPMLVSAAPISAAPVSAKKSRVSRNGPPMQRCRQAPEMEDCFARNKIGNCKALEDTNYPCGKCPFYKPREVFEEEVQRSRRRLIAIGRMDLIARYECRK